MTTMETAEEIVTIMECCSAAYQKRKGEKPSEEILVMLTTRCHSQLISNTIQESRTGKKTSTYESTSIAGKCEECGRNLTDKEKQWILDHNAEYICYHCKLKKK